MLQDLETSEELATKLNALFPEDQIYRQVCGRHHLRTGHLHSHFLVKPVQQMKYAASSKMPCIHLK